MPRRTDNCLVDDHHDKRVPISGCQRLHGHTTSNLNTNAYVPGFMITANGFTYMEHASLITNTNFTCLIF